MRIVTKQPTNCKVVATVLLLLWLVVGSVAIYTLSDADRQAFLCDHPCNPVIEKAAVLPQLYRVLIYTNQVRKGLMGLESVILLRTDTLID